MTQSNCTKYSRNFTNTFPFSNTGAMTLLAASTAIAFTVPGNPNQQYRAHFSVDPTKNLWVNVNGTATLPTSNTMTSITNQERIGIGNNVKYVNGGDVLSLISDATPEVGISLLLVQDQT